MKSSLLLLLIVIVFSSACVNTVTLGEGLATSIQTSPRVFAGEDVKIFIDVENKDLKLYKNVEVDLFDTGFLTGEECKKDLGEIRSGETKTFVCTLKAPDSINEDYIENTISAKTTYSSSLRLLSNIEVISSDEYERRRVTGKLVEEDGTEAISDNSLMAEISFNQDLPIVRRGDQPLLFLTIENAGSGILQKLDQGKIKLESGIVKSECVNKAFDVLDSKYPKITCEMNIGDVEDIENHDILVEIQYSYDVRDKIFIDIVR